MASGIRIDASDVLEVFASLSVSEMTKVHRTALRKSAQVLVKEARLKLEGVTGRSRSTRTADRRGWSKIAYKRGRINTLRKGIRMYVSRDADFAKVHIMKDFRLKFFELGTDDRQKRSGASTGAMLARPFFIPAVHAAKGKMVKTLERSITDAVTKKAKQ